MDAVSESRLADVWPELARRISLLASLLSFPLRVSRGLCTLAEQDALWQKGRNLDGSYIDPIHHAGVVTNAKGDHSMHPFGLAGDVVPLINGVPDWNDKDARWAEILAKAPSCRLAEGAQWRTFPDDPHLYPVEVPASPTDAMRAAMASGGVQAVWAIFQPAILDAGDN